MALDGEGMSWFYFSIQTQIKNGFDTTVEVIENAQFW